MLASTHTSLRRGKWTPKGDGSRGTVTLLTGCVMEGIFTETNRATERTLEHNDYRMVEPARGQGCCGALHAHAGDIEKARELARRNVAAFERIESDYIVATAAGCGAMMKEYGQLLHDDPEWAARAEAVARRVRDVSELLAAAGPKPAGTLPIRVTYDAPCHLLHAQRISRQPIAVLQAVRGATLVPLEGADQCCGSAGIFNFIVPEVADAVLDPKLRNIRESEAKWVATGNPGCLMQIGAGMLRNGIRAEAVHPVELLDAAYAKDESAR
jgi:glycolate oxidase iron-sulfur subunit